MIENNYKRLTQIRIGSIQIVLLKVCLVFILASGIYNCSGSASSRQTYNHEVSILKQNSEKKIPEYRLGFGDEVEIKFFNNARFNETNTVRPDGRITLEKIGDLYVNGMTPSQLDSVVTVTYADIIRDPDVTVFVRKFGSYQVYILGEVEKPGGYAVERNMTIVQALAVSGGVKFSAAISSIMILRQGKNENIRALKIDISHYLAGEQLNIDVKGIDLEFSINEFYIQPLDLIYVPKTHIASIVAFLEQVYAGVLPPIDVYLRALWWRR